MESVVQRTRQDAKSNKCKQNFREQVIDLNIGNKTKMILGTNIQNTTSGAQRSKMMR